MLSYLKSWLMLLRIPNWFTVPGDVIVGYLLSAGDIRNIKIIYTVCCVLLLYIFGLITNDIADIKEDKKERPTRPLVAGNISVSLAKKAAWIFLLSGYISAFIISLDTFISAIFLSGLIVIYNFFLKKYFLGVFILGLCRINAVYIGMVASGEHFFSVPSPLILGFMFVEFIFIVSLSLAARTETQAQFSIFAGIICLSMIPAWASIIILLFFPLALKGYLGFIWYVSMGVGAFSVLLWFLIVYRAIKEARENCAPQYTQKCIGELILSLIFFQSSALLFNGYCLLSIILLLLYIPAKLTGKSFYSS